MPYPMTVTWKCTQCGTAGKLFHTTDLPLASARVDSYKAHGQQLGGDSTTIDTAHLSAIVIHFQRKRVASTQLLLFE